MWITHSLRLKRCLTAAPFVLGHQALLTYIQNVKCTQNEVRPPPFVPSLTLLPFNSGVLLRHCYSPHSMQSPTCTNLRIRSPSDVRVVFHAVLLDILPMVTRRLDSEERGLIVPGSVYVWEERGVHAEITGVSFAISKMHTRCSCPYRSALKDGLTVRTFSSSSTPNQAFACRHSMGAI
jgi:hypothetical protein